MGYRYDIKHVLGDGTKGLTAAKNSELSHCRCLMLWAHTVRKIWENRKMIPKKNGTWWKVIF